MFPYLSTGPTPKLVSDFWQMIWDHRPPVIVMLTQPEEKGKVIQYDKLYILYYIIILMVYGAELFGDQPILTSLYIMHHVCVVIYMAKDML